MLNGHQPASLVPRPLLLTDLRNNRTSTVFFTHYNDDGYQYTIPVGRDYWHTWAMPFRVDPESYRYHRMDPLAVGTGYAYLTTKHLQAQDHFTVNDEDTTVGFSTLPGPLAKHGSSYYRRTFESNSWTWGTNNKYKDTKFTVMAAGDSDE